MMQTYRGVVASGDSAALASIIIVEAAMPKIDVCQRSFDLQKVDGFFSSARFIGAALHHIMSRLSSGADS
jgi:hypothetical protein